MNATWGLIFAIIALLAWTIGDFSIQRATRAVGSWKTLFFIGLLGAVIFFPFAKKDLPLIFSDRNTLALFLLLSVITLVSAIFLFEGMKRGKLAIVEPVFGLELPFTIGFSIVLGGEKLPPILYALMFGIFISLMLVVTKDLKRFKFQKVVLEKGVVYAAIGSIGMGLMNFLVGVGSQRVSPLATIWFEHAFLALACLAYFLIKGRIKTLIPDLKKNFLVISSESIFDNVAWIAYAASMAILPISIATTVSESYIAFAVLLGIVFNKEKLRRHQAYGVGAVIVGVLVLSWLSTNI